MNHITLFSLIAPYYNFTYNSQKKKYRKYLKENSGKIPEKTKRILDVGCGTGALAYVLNESGYEVTATDASSVMLKFARFNLRKTSVRTVKSDLTKVLPFEDKSFDLITSAYVLHGFKKEIRYRFYKEIKRVAKKAVLFHEFFPNRSFLISFIEWLERSDYFYFVHNGREELEQNFSYVKSIRVSPSSGWYICYV